MEAIQNVNLIIKQRCNFYKQLLIRNTTTGNPQDLTGWTARMEIRKDAGKPLLIALATPEASDGAPVNTRIVIQEPPTNGVMTLQILPADTGTLAAGEYQYDVLVYDSNGVRQAVMCGRCLIVTSITT